MQLPSSNPGRDGIYPYCRHPYTLYTQNYPGIGSQPCGACRLGKTLARVFGDGQVLGERDWMPLEEFARLVGRSVSSFTMAVGWRNRLQLQRMEGHWMVPSAAIGGLVASWIGPERPLRCGESKV